MITRAVFQSFLDCKHKAYLQLSGTPAAQEPSQFLELSRALELENRQEILRLTNPKWQSGNFTNDADTQSLMTSGEKFILLANFSNDLMQTTVDILERVSGQSKLGPFYYQPMIIIRSSSISASDKLLLGFLSILLTETQARTPQFGKIIFGKERKSQKIHLPKLIRKAQQIVNVLNCNRAEPRIFLNSHCKVCEYQKFCQQKAQAKDDLSLLSRISLKEVESLNSRGIITVAQLSQKFRPNKRYKSTEQISKPRSFSLQALAIQNKKVHVYNCPSQNRDACFRIAWNTN